MQGLGVLKLTQQRFSSSRIATLPGNPRDKRALAGEVTLAIPDVTKRLLKVLEDLFRARDKLPVSRRRTQRPNTQLAALTSIQEPDPRFLSLSRAVLRRPQYIKTRKETVRHRTDLSRWMRRADCLSCATATVSTGKKREGGRRAHIDPGNMADISQGLQLAAGCERAGGINCS